MGKCSPAFFVRPSVLTLEDHSLQNGFGSAVIEYAVAHNLPTQNITTLGMPDRMIAHATRKQQLAEVGLDCRVSPKHPRRLTAPANRGSHDPPGP